MGALEQDREKIAQLARSSDAQKLRELLEQQSGQVRQAAQQAAEGAALVDRIGAQAKQAGLG